MIVECTEVIGPGTSGGGGDGPLVINDQTDSYVLQLPDANDYVRMDKATALNLTIPPNSSVDFPIGTVITIRQVGVGQVTIVEGVGVTANGEKLIVTQNRTASIIQVAIDEWDITGSVTT